MSITLTVRTVSPCLLLVVAALAWLPAMDATDSAAGGSATSTKEPDAVPAPTSSGTTAGTPVQPSSHESNPPAAGLSQDQQFVNRATSAGMFEIEASKLALSRDVPQAVKDAATMMIRDHTQAGNRLTQLAASEGDTVPSKMDAVDQEAYDKLSKRTGQDFVKCYDKGQLIAHDQAIALFQDEVANTKDKDFRGFAQETLPTLQHHRAMVGDLPYNQTTPPVHHSAWYRFWHGSDKTASSSTTSATGSTDSVNDTTPERSNFDHPAPYTPTAKPDGTGGTSDASDAPASK